MARNKLDSSPVAVIGLAYFWLTLVFTLRIWLLGDPEVPVGVLIYLLVLETPWATAPLTVVLGGLMGGSGGAAGTAGGLGALAGLLDADGDGNPLDDILGRLGR